MSISNACISRNDALLNASSNGAASIVEKHTNSKRPAQKIDRNEVSDVESAARSDAYLSVTNSRSTATLPGEGPLRAQTGLPFCQCVETHSHLLRGPKIMMPRVAPEEGDEQRSSACGRRARTGRPA